MFFYFFRWHILFIWVLNIPVSLRLHLRMNILKYSKRTVGLLLISLSLSLSLRLCQMGCYGIGVSRLLQAIVEYNLIKHSGRMIWPLSVAPVKVCVTPLIFKKARTTHTHTHIYNTI